jgi:hypothetical protein
MAYLAVYSSTAPTALTHSMFRTTLLALSTALLLFTSVQAQTVPTPKDHFGFNIGDDYQLATFTQTEAYFKKLAASPRTKLTTIGKTEEGRDPKWRGLKG